MKARIGVGVRNILLGMEIFPNLGPNTVLSLFSQQPAYLAEMYLGAGLLETAGLIETAGLFFEMVINYCTFVG